MALTGSFVGWALSPCGFSAFPFGKFELQYFEDGKWISFLANRGDKGSQIYLIRKDGGEAFKVTDHAEGINSYLWFPSGDCFVFSATNPSDDQLETREKQYGRFEVEDVEYRLTHLWKVNIDRDNPNKAERLTSSEDFSTDQFIYQSRHLHFGCKIRTNHSACHSTWIRRWT